MTSPRHHRWPRGHQHRQSWLAAGALWFLVVLVGGSLALALGAGAGAATTVLASLTGAVAAVAALLWTIEKLVKAITKFVEALDRLRR